MVPLTLLSSAFGRVAIGAALAVAAWVWGYNSGSASAERGHKAALAEALAVQQQEVAKAIARGDALSAKLAAKQRELNTLKTEYHTYANAITGNCPASVGVLIDSAARGSDLPEAARPSADPTAAIAASIVAANVAENYSRANACIAQLNALLAWHQAGEGVK